MIEPKEIYWAWLDENVEELKASGAQIEVRKKRFTLDDINGCKFAKFDCEGCEYEISLENLGIPWVAEMHEKSQPDSNGVYGYERFIGYQKGTGISER